jgi:hypothetical protein
MLAGMAGLLPKMREEPIGRLSPWQVKSVLICCQYQGQEQRQFVTQINMPIDANMSGAKLKLHPAREDVFATIRDRSDHELLNRTTCDELLLRNLWQQELKK